MATRPKFAKMANYSCKCVKCESHFSRNDLWPMSASLASPSRHFGEFGDFGEFGKFGKF